MDKLKMYSFVDEGNTTTPIEDRYILIKQGWWASLRKVGDINKCLAITKFDSPSDMFICSSHKNEEQEEEEGKLVVIRSVDQYFEMEES